MTTIDREASTAVVKLPPGPPLPLAVQGVLALANRRIALQIVRRVYRDDAFDDADHSQRHTARCARSRGARAGATARNTAPGIKLGSKLALIPVPQWDWGRWSPWGRFFQYRREYDAIGDRLIDKAQADPSLASHDDVLALMLQSRYEDGSPMTRAEIADELITMLAAGHETTATTLAWAVERLQRHPQLLDRLVADLDAGSEDLLTATVFEILRTRPVIDTTFRQVKVPTLQIRPWTVPQGHTIVASIGLLHADESVFHDARRFDPDRFISRRPDHAEWIPAAESADASALLSRPWRYASSCELCCATTSSALPTLATKAGNRAGWR